MSDLHQLLMDEPTRARFQIHRRAYVDPQLLTLEKERIFDKCWLYAGHESEVRNPHDFVSRKVGGRPVIIAKGADQQIRILFNRCRHRGAEVCREPRGNAKHFTCPYHYWMYDSQGKLAGLPGHDAYTDSLDRKEMGLVPVPRMENYRGFLFICFDPNACTLVEFLSGARAYLDYICDQSETGMEIMPGCQIYGTRANWKFLSENSIDFYHAPKLHKRFFDYVRESGGTGQTATRIGYGRALGNGHAVSEYSPPPAGRPIAWWGPPFPESRKAEIAERRRRLEERVGPERAKMIGDSNRLLLIFPNLIINDTVGIMVRTFFPSAVDHMDVSMWSLAPVGETDEYRKVRIDNLHSFAGPGGFATPDDVEVLQSCQRGLSIGEVEWLDCSRGMHLPEPRFDDERHIRAFWRRWHELITNGEVMHPDLR